MRGDDLEAAGAQGLPTLMRSNSRLRWFLTLPVLAIVLLAFSISCSGCLWLMIPSLAYQGYKYEHKSESSSSSSSSEDSSPKRSQRSNNSDSSIE
ncbi:MAG: hypothetical protein ACREQN_15530 [Candidatus Binataceae bacterium]